MQSKKQILEITQEKEIDTICPNFRPQGNFCQSDTFQKSNYNNQKAWQPHQQNSTSSQKLYNSTNQRTGNNSNKNGIMCVYCKKQGHHQDNCRSRIRDNTHASPTVENLLPQEGKWGHEWINHQRHHPFGFSLKDSVVPQTGSLDVMQQIILSICNVSIAANNKISECTNSFNGETSFIWPHISITVAGNARSWLFDTGAVSGAQL